jgi:hypothetical protein
MGAEYPCTWHNSQQSVRHVAAKSGFVNIHLLVSPEDRDHLAGSSASASAYNDRCDCTREELGRLGMRADPTIIDVGAALRHGWPEYKWLVDLPVPRRIKAMHHP